LYLYRLLLLLYPPAYREALSGEMIDVFQQARRAAEDQGLEAKVKFYLRELLGLIAGVCRERTRRRSIESAMRSFRFPGWIIALMVLLLLELVAAIDMARIVSIKTLSPGADVSMGWFTPDFALGVIAFMGAFGLVGYGLLFAAGRTGIQRLPEVRTWPTKDAKNGSSSQRG
jgi:hypothetical protein